MIFRDTGQEHIFFRGQSQSSIRAYPETITLGPRHDSGAIRGSSQCVGRFPQLGGKRNQLSIIRHPGTVPRVLTKTYEPREVLVTFVLEKGAFFFTKRFS